MAGQSTGLHQLHSTAGRYWQNLGHPDQSLLACVQHTLMASLILMLLYDVEVEVYM